MDELRNFEEHDVDWEMTPEAAVTLYLEWGNNCWLGEFKPVRHRSDSTTYFVISTWEPEPKLMLIHRTCDEAKELAVLPLPTHLRENFMHDVGFNKGIYPPTPEIKDWLRTQMHN
ncbi:MAG: DVU0772 family protein [Acidobacteriota bacterium]